MSIGKLFCHSSQETPARSAVLVAGTACRRTGSLVAVPVASSVAHFKHMTRGVHNTSIQLFFHPMAL